MTPKVNIYQIKSPKLKKLNYSKSDQLKFKLIKRVSQKQQRPVEKEQGSQFFLTSVTNNNNSSSNAKSSYLEDGGQDV